jgi:hypothetical protein
MNDFDGEPLRALFGASATNGAFHEIYHESDI